MKQFKINISIFNQIKNKINGLIFYRYIDKNRVELKFLFQTHADQFKHLTKL